MDGLEALHGRSVAALLHVTPRIVVVDYRGEREVIDRRRRGRRPFQRPGVPWIASYVAQRFAVADTDVDLHEKRQDAAENQQRTECSDQRPYMQGRVVEMPQPPGHPHQPHHVERREGEPEPQNPAPERYLSPEKRELEAECLGKTGVDAR